MLDEGFVEFFLARGLPLRTFRLLKAHGGMISLPSASNE
jgi:hypothetical protein